jgi:FtsP/CotA-like multicopper oxidase with cupredoxin domain
VKLNQRIFGSVPLGLALLVPALAFGQVPFPTGWANQPVGNYRQDVFPYPGQCYTGKTQIGNLPACDTTNAPSFACTTGGLSNQSAFSTACGSVTAPPAVLGNVNAVQSYADSKFKWEVLNPPDYSPDTIKYTGADYYEIGVHEAQGFQILAGAGLFPNPGATNPVPNGKQWTGLVDPTSKAPLFTPIWGVGQLNTPATAPLKGVLDLTGTANAGPAAPWSANSYVATWPSISIRGTTGKPVVVKWVNEFPNNHLFCPHPEAADWPCAIDRTFMGVKATVDPGAATAAVPYDRINQFGSPQQPDNSWVTHLHGGEIPPQTDGFAEKWFGNSVTAAAYNPTAQLINPLFGAPFNASTQAREIPLIYRPTVNNDVYAYPMVNQESTIWFHDHTLGKTHHNVVAGPAGFFPVKDPTKHNSQVAGACSVANPGCEYTWIDPVTEPRDTVGSPKYDLFLAIQDRAFNTDGTLNFPSGMSNVPAPPPPAVAAVPPAPAALGPSGYPFAPGNTATLPGPNPQVHPVWVPEYFADHAVVNGVLWPKKTVTPGWYRIRIVDGSDSRCYTLGFGTVEPALPTAAAAAPAPIRNVRFHVIANEQGYLPAAVMNQTSLTMCPGERYEVLIDFSGKSIAVTGGPAAAPLAGQSIFMNNTAAAPYPVGISPQAIGSNYAAMGTIMRFDVMLAGTAALPPVLSCPTKGLNVTGLGGIAGTDWPAALGCMKIPAVLDQDFVNVKNYPDCPRPAGGAPDLTFNGGNCIATERQLYLNERVDGTTLASMGLQINGVPFEYDVTETPKKGTWERWKVINATVDAHPIHPHLIKAQITGRQAFNKGKWLTALCGGTTCQPGAAPGNIQQITPDVTPSLTGTVAVPATVEAGWKDVIVAPPNKVTTIVARWDGAWTSSTAVGGTDITAPGAGNPTTTVGADAKTWIYPDVTSGPYVWHCHINSHEDSEMMRSSLVVK